MNPTEYSIGLVFLAGLASFFSPCTIPILPGYLCYLAARASGVAPGEVRKLQVLLHGLAFVLGFSVLFIALGATASLVGRALLIYREWIFRAGGVLMVILGLHLAGVFRLPFLDFEARLHAQPDSNLGYASSFVMGLSFSAGWTPCIGPVLTSVLMLAAFEASLTRGLLLLAVYALGIGIPFLVFALVFDCLGGTLRRMARIARYVSIAAGLILAAIGLLLATGQLAALARWLPGWDFGL